MGTTAVRPLAFQGKKLMAVRRGAGLNRDGLAALTGIPADTIAKYERNARTPRADTLGLLAAALGCRLDDLFAVAS